MTTRVITNIGELTTNDPTLGRRSPSGRLHDAAMVIDDATCPVGRPERGRARPRTR